MNQNIKKIIIVFLVVGIITISIFGVYYYNIEHQSYYYQQEIEVNSVNLQIYGYCNGTYTGTGTNGYINAGNAFITNISITNNNYYSCTISNLVLYPENFDSPITDSKISNSNFSILRSNIPITISGCDTNDTNSWCSTATILILIQTPLSISFNGILDIYCNSTQNISSSQYSFSPPE